LNLDPKVLSYKFASHPSSSPNELPHWVIKLISYPPSSSTQDDDSHHQGVGAHTDTNFLTLVLQDTVGGLQAFSQGEWVNVPTSDDGSNLVCNLGEQAEIWSRGYFLATPHRVLPNTSAQTRISVPLFYNPVLSATIEPLEESSSLQNVQWDRPRVTNDDRHWRRDNNAMLPTVGDNTFKSLARSHPEVFQRHHPDLMLLDDGRILPRESKSETHTSIERPCEA
jgi:isopenicillin N synthase-like dioxygenase